MDATRRPTTVRSLAIVDAAVVRGVSARVKMPTVNVGSVSTSANLWRSVLVDSIGSGRMPRMSVAAISAKEAFAESD
jgi:hypothetical protein